MTIFAVGSIESNTIKTIILSCSNAGLGGASEDTVRVIKDIIEDCKECLISFIKTCEILCQDFQYGAPSPESLPITNFSKVAFATDMCDQDYKARMLLLDEVVKVEIMLLLFNHASTNVTLIDQHYQIPSPDYLTQDLESDATIDSTDNFVNNISEKNIRLKIDFHHHLCNGWVKYLNKNLWNYLRKALANKVKEIEPCIRVTIGMGSVTREL